MSQERGELDELERGNLRVGRSTFKKLDSQKQGI
jgi:hypothetical protein